MLLCSVKIVQVPTTNERKETGEMTSDVSNVNLLAAILLIVQHIYQMLVMTCTWSAVRLCRITTGHLGGEGGEGRIVSGG